MPPSRDTEDGPQSATRHKQDRRPSTMPTNRPEQRYSMTSSKKRTAFERQQEEMRELSSAIPLSNVRGTPREHSQSVTAPCSEAAQVGQRISRLEQAATNYETLHTRLVTFEGLLKPYVDYEKRVLIAVEDLKQFETRLRMSNFSKPDAATKQLVDKHEASLQEHATRLQQLSDRNESARAQPQSTTDLATSLLYRLNHGDLLNDQLAQSLCEKLGGTVNQVRQELTPATDDHHAGEDNEDTAETPRHSMESEPKKRLRVSGSSSSAPPTRKKSISRQPTPRSSRRSALDSFRSGALSTDRSSIESRQNEEEAEESGAPSSRPVRAKKPTYHPDYVPWEKANPLVRNMRRNGSSPTKGPG